jgi:alpha-amylase
MVSVCLYFHVHQPFRLNDYHVFDIGDNTEYFDDEENKRIAQRVTEKCYLPMNNLLLDLINEYPERFHVSFSISGTAIEQLEAYAPEALQSFQDLAATGNVEFVNETYHHSLGYIESKDEFDHQVQKHRDALNEYFDYEPTTFRNTELIFNNELASYIEDKGYNALLGEGADHLLGWRHANHVYRAKTTDDLDLFLRNYELSDDIAFRFSNEDWEHHPLSADTFAEWINAINGSGEIINLFMDYETFGEHQWPSTGIFDFFEHMVEHVLANDDNDFLTIEQASERYPSRGEIDAHHYTSWADARRDLGAWQGNKLQQQSHEQLYELEDHIKEQGDETMLETWRRLTTSDHVYYMYTDGMSDGDVHDHFSPYDSPYDSYMYYMNVMNDLARRLGADHDKPVAEAPSALLNSIGRRKQS